MSADLFISYAWTSDEHREWVRLLAAHLKAIGYDVLVDADVDYGDRLTGFMRRVVECRHVLLVVDENYVDRADNMPTSGVGVENRELAAVYSAKPPLWLSVLFRDNPGCQLPAWLVASNPRGHVFNANPARANFPGSEQVEDLWRWIEDLPANRDHAVPVATLRERGRRLEEVDRKRDPNSWASPGVEGDVYFEFEQAPGMTYTLGYADLGFEFHVSSCGANAVYVYKDPIHAVGLNRTGASQHQGLAEQLTPGRHVIGRTGDQIILQNKQGALCTVDILEVKQEATTLEYVPASVRFRYRILLDS